MKYRKRPVIIEAKQFKYNQDDLAELSRWMGESFGTFRKERHPDAVGELEVRTLEDGGVLKVKHIATEGDWIIRGVQGEFYACKPDIFEQTYERVE